MADAEVLDVTSRDKLGTSNTRRLRKAGQIPAVLYGHGEAVVHLAAKTLQVSSAIRHGAHLVQLKGAVAESALIREVQWDALGSDILHIDLTRVSAGERVELTIAIELRGVAPGTREGGVVQLISHEVELECPVTAIPDKFEVNINSLNLDETITMSDLELPEGSTLLSPPDAVIVQCVEAVEEEEEEEEGLPGDLAGPEVIGRKEEDEESDE